MLVVAHLHHIVTARTSNSSKDYYWCTVLSHVDKISTIVSTCVFLVWVRSVRTPVVSTIVGVQFISFLTTTHYVWSQTVVYTLVALILALLYVYHVIRSPIACSSEAFVYPLSLWLIHAADLMLCLLILAESQTLILRILLNIAVLATIYTSSTKNLLSCG